MRLQKFGHSCLLVSSGDGRVLIDPGTFSAGFEQIEGITAILITHQHPDHVDFSRLPALLDRNPDAQLVADSATAQSLRADSGVEATVARAGDTLDVGMPVEVVGELHAQIHPDIPQVPNVGYRIDGRLLHPGDSVTPPDGDVEVLALPTMAPWMRMADAIDYLRAVAPRIAVPIHEALLRSTDIFYGAFRALGPEHTELKVLDGGEPVEV